MSAQVIQFRPRARDAVEIKNVRLVKTAENQIGEHMVALFYEIDPPIDYTAPDKDLA